MNIHGYSKQTISKSINHLASLNYINLKYEKDSTNNSKRTITLDHVLKNKIQGIKENFNSCVQPNFKHYNKSNINKIYLTTYNLEKFKNEVENNTTYRREFKEYIDYLPTYSKNSAKVNNSNYFHVIIEYSKGSEYNYGIMEVHIR